MFCKGYWGCHNDSECDDFEDRQECLISKSEVNVKEHMRMLWEEHIIWTRLTIISISAALPDLDLTVKRLLRNARDFEMAFNPLYGEEKAHIFGSLMRDHLVIAGQLVKAARAGDRKAALAAEHAWYENADKIATFLSSINPNWPENTMRTMLHEHLRLTESEAIAILTGEHGRGIATFDEIEKQALMMADSLTEGIVKQFPDIFVRES